MLRSSRLSVCFENSDPEFFEEPMRQINQPPSLTRKGRGPCRFHPIETADMLVLPKPMTSANKSIIACGL
jgi:hypothetical protein